MTLAVTDIQFTGRSDTEQKLRRLVEDLQAAEKAINGLITAVNTLATASPEDSFVLATTNGLGPNFTVSGLTEGLVLKAISATNAAFKQLAFTELSGVDIVSPQPGQILTYEYGQWVNASPTAGEGIIGGANVGPGAGVYLGVIGQDMMFRSIEGDGSTIAVTQLSDAIQISAIQAQNNLAQNDAMAFFNGY